jgi:hypothetical protein
MLRKPDWQSALAGYLDRCALAPFGYGVLDCGLFAAGAIEAMTGVDVAGDLRGRYSNRREALAALLSVCGARTMEGAVAMLAARYGTPAIAPAYAQRGDAVLFGRGRGSSLGIVAMHGTEALAPGRHGTLRMPLSRVTLAWRI